jgi:hypothetical protein
MGLSLKDPSDDISWGCSFQEVLDAAGLPNIKVCYVQVRDVAAFAQALGALVLDQSWMTALDHGVRRQYDYTARETAAALIDIFQATSTTGSIGVEFGELLVSIGSARALETIFTHVAIPIAELWKPQIKQNEGFDFHTTCPESYINFGEAKYSGTINPHGLAISQAADFLSAEKHLRDRGHLVNLVDASSIALLDADKFGLVAAFSINSKDPLKIFSNAIASAKTLISKHRVERFYVVGISK